MVQAGDCPMPCRARAMLRLWRCLRRLNAQRRQPYEEGYRGPEARVHDDRSGILPSEDHRRGEWCKRWESPARALATYEKVPWGGRADHQQVKQRPQDGAAAPSLWTFLFGVSLVRFWFGFCFNFASPADAPCAARFLADRLTLEGWRSCMPFVCGLSGGFPRADYRFL